MYQGWSLCPASQSIECLIHQGHCCQSTCIGQLFGLCIHPAPRHRTDEGHVGSSQSQGCGPGVDFAGRLDFCRPRRIFLARSFCKRSHPQPLRRRGLTLLLLIIHVHSHPRCSTHGKMPRGSLKKVSPLPDTSLGQRAPPLSLSKTSQPIQQRSSPTSCLVGFFIVRKVKKSTELCPAPSPRLWASISPPVKWGG